MNSAMPGYSFADARDPSPASALPSPLFKWWQELIAEILLLCMTLVAIVNIGRLFSESLWISHVILIAVLCHVLWSVTRRLRFPMPIAAVVNFAVVGFLFPFLEIFQRLRQICRR